MFARKTNYQNKRKCTDEEVLEDLRHRRKKKLTKQYPCDQCDYVATRSDHIKRHKENKHEGVQYPCDQCDYTATQSGNLKKHIESPQYRRYVFFALHNSSKLT